MDNGTTNLNKPTPGHPTLAAVREPLVRNLSDALYAGGQALIQLSRAVERREVADYLTQAHQVGAHMLQLVTLCGQLGSLTELEGGRTHGKVVPTFPERDGDVESQIEAFKAKRALEKTQRRPLADIALEEE